MRCERRYLLALLSLLLLLPGAAYAAGEEPPSEFSIALWIAAIDEMVDPILEDIAGSLNSLLAQEEFICGVTRGQFYGIAGGLLTLENADYDPNEEAEKPSAQSLVETSIPGFTPDPSLASLAEAETVSSASAAAAEAYEGEEAGSIALTDSTMESLPSIAWSLGSALGESVGWMRALLNNEVFDLSLPMRIIIWTLLSAWLFVAAMITLYVAMHVIGFVAAVVWKLISLIPGIG